VAAGLNNWSHKSFNNRAENSHMPFRNENEPCRVANRQERCNSSFLCTALPTSLSVSARRRAAQTIRYRLEAFDASKIAACIA
jgi:hypothetical protein